MRPLSHPLAQTYRRRIRSHPPPPHPHPHPTPTPPLEQGVFALQNLRITSSDLVALPLHSHPNSGCSLSQLAVGDPLRVVGRLFAVLSPSTTPPRSRSFYPQSAQRPQTLATSFLAAHLFLSQDSIQSHRDPGDPAGSSDLARPLDLAQSPPGRAAARIGAVWVYLKGAY